VRYFVNGNAIRKSTKTDSKRDAIAFAKEYTDLKSGTISEQLETECWLGDTASANVNINKFDGFIKLIDNSSAAIASNTAAFTNGGAIVTATGITVSNVVDIINGIILALPAVIQGKSDIRVWCGWDVFSKFITKLVALNLFHYSPVGSEISQEAMGEIIIPGTQYKLTAVHGLDGTNRLFGMRASNMFLGTDLENEEEKWELFYAKEAMEVRFVSEWKLGVQVGIPNEIAQFKLI
jgi:hypothetical protein